MRLNESDTLISNNIYKKELDDNCEATMGNSYTGKFATTSFAANTIFRLTCCCSSVAIGFIILLNPKLKRHPSGLIGYICLFIGGFLQFKGQLNFVCKTG